MILLPLILTKLDLGVAGSGSKLDLETTGILPSPCLLFLSLKLLQFFSYTCISAVST
ncbi:hypothetical protein KI387_025555, partial [Taxus chinensis]